MSQAQISGPHRGQAARRALLALATAFVLPVLPGTARADDTASMREAAQLADRYVQPTLRFEPCAQNPRLECGSLRVPIDYRQPWLGHVDLAVVRAQATQRSRLGVLFANPGGPGASGVDLVLQGVNAPGFARLRERFDIVSFDVRGSHRSRAAQCEAPLPAAPVPAAIDAFSQVLAAECLRKLGPLATSMSTNNIARDLEILRRALGEKQITIVGQSYGTLLASVYASLFPQHVRGMLLDAAFYPHFHDGHVEMRAEQLLSFETVLQRLDQVCSTSAVCRLRTAGVSATLEALKLRLAQAPITGPGGAVLSVSGLQGSLQPLLSAESRWPLLVDALADAAAGNFALLFQLLGGASGGVGSSTGMFTMTAQSLIICNDFGTRRPAAEYLPVSAALTAVSSRVMQPFSVAFSMAGCAAWPEADLPLIRKSAVPALLIGGDFDPNTPLSWTLGLASLLGAENQVLRYRGGGHTSYATNGNTCIDALGNAFLFELKLPPPRTSCAPQPIKFRAAAGPNSDAAAGLRVQ